MGLVHATEEGKMSPPQKESQVDGMEFFQSYRSDKQMAESSLNTAVRHFEAAEPYWSGKVRL